jgi:hypothetical protein
MLELEDDLKVVGEAQDGRQPVALAGCCKTGSFLQQPVRAISENFQDTRSQFMPAGLAPLAGAPFACLAWFAV